MSVVVPPEGLDDATLEWAAQEIEQGSLLDLRGIMAPRKRDREDAELRMAARRDLRKELAEHLRAFKSRRDLDARETLKRVVERSNESDCGIALDDAWPLAWKGWINIHATILCNSNQIPPETQYSVTLTDRGREILEAQP